MSESSAAPAVPGDDSPQVEPQLADVPSVDQISSGLASIVAATGGVLRIEPTLRGTVTAWRRGDDEDDPAQHLQVTARGRVVDVNVNLAVAADREARLLGHRLRARLQDYLTGQGLTGGSIEISILVIEPT